MNPLPEVIDALGATHAWTYLALFLGGSLLMIWRLESLLRHGLEGTALGTLVMPYCSGLGNLVFVGMVVAGRAPPPEVLTNCLVNNVTNMTLVLALPALCWGLTLADRPAPKPKTPKGKSRSPGARETEGQLNRLSLLLTLAAVFFFTAATWVLSEDGVLDFNDGLVLVGLFLFWQCFQVFDVLKHNVRQQRAFGALFYVDVLFVLLGAFGVYTSLDWLVTWLMAQKGSFVNASNLGWLTGWLMVLPNALLAFYYAARNRADIAYASQVGDGHICVPLCIGLAALAQPIRTPTFFATGLAILAGAAVLHVACVTLARGLPRWMGWPLLAGYGWFIAVGLF